MVDGVLRQRRKPPGNSTPPRERPPTNPNEPQRAPTSPNEPQRAPTSHNEPQRATTYFQKYPSRAKGQPFQPHLPFDVFTVTFNHIITTSQGAELPWSNRLEVHEYPTKFSSRERGNRLTLPEAESSEGADLDLELSVVGKPPGIRVVRLASGRAWGLRSTGLGAGCAGGHGRSDRWTRPGANGGPSRARRRGLWGRVRRRPGRR